MLIPYGDILVNLSHVRRVRYWPAIGAGASTLRIEMDDGLEHDLRAGEAERTWAVLSGAAAPGSVAFTHSPVSRGVALTAAGSLDAAAGMGRRLEALEHDFETLTAMVASCATEATARDHGRRLARLENRTGSRIADVRKTLACLESRIVEHEVAAPPAGSAVELGRRLDALEQETADGDAVDAIAARLEVVEHRVRGDDLTLTRHGREIAGVSTRLESLTSRVLALESRSVEDGCEQEWDDEPPDDLPRDARPEPWKVEVGALVRHRDFESEGIVLRFVPDVIDPMVEVRRHDGTTRTWLVRNLEPAPAAKPEPLPPGWSVAGEGTLVGPGKWDAVPERSEIDGEVAYRVLARGGGIAPAPNLFRDRRGAIARAGELAEAEIGPALPARVVRVPAIGQRVATVRPWGNPEAVVLEHYIGLVIGKLGETGTLVGLHAVDPVDPDPKFAEIAVREVHGGDEPDGGADRVDVGAVLACPGCGGTDLRVDEMYRCLAAYCRSLWRRDELVERPAGSCP